MATLGLSLLEQYGNSATDFEGDYIRQSGLEDLSKTENALPSSVPVDYESARQVFLFTQRSLLEARDTFFHFESHCNDYIDITLSYSKLFKLMALIETEAHRQIAMHRRRVDMLSSIVEF